MTVRSPRLPLNLFGGVCGAVLCGLGGAVGSISLALGLTIGRWLVEGTTPYMRELDLQSIEREMLNPVIGCTLVCAGAGFSIFAPHGTHRFTRSLVEVCLGSVMLWLVLWSLELTPRRYKEIQHPPLYPSELLILIGPPIAVASILTAIRSYSANQR